MAADISVEETVQKINSLTEKTLNELFLKWKKMYKVNDELKIRNFETFVSHVEELYQGMLSTEEIKLVQLSEEVESKLLEIVQLERELGVVISKVNTDLPLQNLISDLDNAMEEFKKMKQEKILSFETLVQKELELCHFLGKERKSQMDHFPKPKDFEDLELFIFELSQEKIERIESRKETKENIKQLFNKLGLEPHTLFEKSLLSINEEIETLTDNDIAEIKELESSLLNKLELEKKNRMFKIDKLKKLWAQIKVPEEDQIEFMNSIGEELTPSVFTKIEEEFARCEGIKLENIKPLIISSKEKLQDLWDKVKFSEEQRKGFCPFYSPFFNEDVLELLEIQVDKMTAFYEENIIIFELVEKWDHLRERVIHLEELSKNKNRLFDNRGGQLLKEEKERKAVENNLPKVYAELEKSLMNYQEKSGTPFLWNGQNLLNKIQEDWFQRELAKKKNLNMKAISPGESLTRSAQKRKLLYTPTSSAKHCKTPSSIRSKSRAVTPVSPPDLSSASIASYSIFQEHIESRYRTPNGLNENDQILSTNTPHHVPPHSSPTFTPLRKLRYTPRNMATPTPKKIINSRTPSKMMTPKSTSKLVTPKSTSKLVTPLSVSKTTATPGSTLKNSSNRRGTPRTPSTLTRTRFTPARKFNLII